MQWMWVRLRANSLQAWQPASLCMGCSDLQWGVFALDSLFLVSHKIFNSAYYFNIQLPTKNNQ
jgi:hypothetical protein